MYLYNILLKIVLHSVTEFDVSQQSLQKENQLAELVQEVVLVATA